ncbi:MAG: triose-phosphate isomerase [Pseudomonadota bacterium]
MGKLRGERVRTLIAGNWKMNGLRSALAEIDAIIAGLGDVPEGVGTLICPPATLIAAAAERAADTALGIGAQDCHTNRDGAHTGDLSAEMLKDAGATHVILGHSERRSDHGELSELVKHKVMATLDTGLVPIVCVGESRADRENGLTDKVVLGQLDASLPREAAGRDIVIAYEPVWAIGTGLTPTTDQIAAVHAAIREALRTRYQAQADTTAILYGGSMKPANAAEILSVDHVDGGLVGGASLKAADFLAICAAAV